MPRRRRGPSPPTSRGLCTVRSGGSPARQRRIVPRAAPTVPRGIGCAPARREHDCRAQSLLRDLRRTGSRAGVAFAAGCNMDRGRHRLDEREDRARLVERLRTADERADRLCHATPPVSAHRKSKPGKALRARMPCHAASCHSKAGGLPVTRGTGRRGDRSGRSGKGFRCLSVFQRQLQVLEFLLTSPARERRAPPCVVLYQCRCTRRGRAALLPMRSAAFR